MLFNASWLKGEKQSALRRPPLLIGWCAVTRQHVPRTRSGSRRERTDIPQRPEGANAVAVRNELAHTAPAQRRHDRRDVVPSAHPRHYPSPKVHDFGLTTLSCLLFACRCRAAFSLTGRPRPGTVCRRLSLAPGPWPVLFVVWKVLMPSHTNMRRV